ncbi:MAG: type I glyceraldehyde-3-phosphate dehydrogenase [Erysipelotrichaceae bacterium]|jgi:glyceraldehyde 3-phosphate dehydrogenase|nr:type I glyceraldehyde-3-phosphate dehydrogenase [Erysipelotrichaceae bacterium]
MTVKVAINGFGRIGRLAFRQIFEHDELEVVAINDLTDAKMLSHLLKYDSAQKSWRKDEISYTEDSIIVAGKKFKILSEKDPANLPWKELGVDVVLECTGFFTSLDKASAHITAGARKVVISAPGSGGMETIVYGVNEDTLDGSETVISAASCTTNCLAPMAKVLNDSFGIEVGYMTTIHAYTNDQNTLDGPHRKGDLRRARAAAASIIPNSTGAAKAIGEVIPALKGKLDGGAQRVPVITGSITELYTILKKQVTVDEVNAAMKAASSESFGYNTDEIVSSDVIGCTYGSLFDATLTKVLTVGDKQIVKTAAWYDNENSYTTQMVRTILYFAKKI